MKVSHSLAESLTAPAEPTLRARRLSLGQHCSASVVLREDGAEPVAMYVVSPDVDEVYRAALAELIGESEMTAWVWNAGVDEMPALPI